MVQLMPIRDARQRAVALWVKETFGEEFQTSITERCLRVIEEAAELVQACGLSRHLAVGVADSVYEREPGDPGQELGGVQICLLALAENLRLSADDMERDEFLRIHDLPKEKFRTSQRRKETDGFVGAQLSDPALVEEALPQQDVVINKHEDHFNKVIFNFNQATLDGKDKKWIKRARTSLEILRAEYSLAVELLDQIRDQCFSSIEIAKNNGGDYCSLAADYNVRYPMLAREIDEFMNLLSTDSRFTGE